MPKINLEDYDDDDLYETVVKIKQKPKSDKAKTGGKGHQSVHQTKQQLADAFNEEEELDEEFIPMSKTMPPSGKVFPPKQQVSTPKVFVPGPNTHVIKNNNIDFDRVANIEKVEGDYNGRKTFGIKFTFMGAKGSFRVAWFNQNVRERDSVYNTEFGFWKSLPSQKK